MRGSSIIENYQSYKDGMTGWEKDSNDAQFRGHLNYWVQGRLKAWLVPSYNEEDIWVINVPSTSPVYNMQNTIVKGEKTAQAMIVLAIGAT